jgi:bifunctional non-homologous end joining protein LigD
MDKAQLPAIALFCTEGSSNKEYRAEVIEVEGGYLISYRNGPRGKLGAAKTKPETPLSIEKAVKEFETLVRDKKKKHYTEDISGVAYTSAENAGTLTGNLPQLLNEIGDDELQAFINNPLFGFQVKRNGQRKMQDRSGPAVVTSNKLARVTTSQQNIVDAVLALSDQDILLDGEDEGDEYHVFDILRLNGESLKDKSYQERYAIFMALDLATPLCKVPMAIGAEAKAAMVEQVRADNLEGVVIKLLDAPYEPGRPSSGGPQRKWKIYGESTCIVTGISQTKRSIKVGLLDYHGNIVEVGSVTVPPNQSIPGEGDLVEVKYMYLFADGGSLFQPVLRGKRTDVLREECKLSQVKRIMTKKGARDEE